MNQRIIYQNDDGGVAVLTPADCGLTIEQIAAKDVPTGKVYKIVDVSDVPTGRAGLGGVWSANLDNHAPTPSVRSASSTVQ